MALARARIRPQGFLHAAMQKLTAVPDGRSLRHGWKPWQRSGPELISSSEEDVLQAAGNYQQLVWRHGRQAVVRFYEDSLWPALCSLPARPPVTEAIERVARTALDFYVAADDGTRLAAWVDRLEAALPQLAFEGGAVKAIAERRRLREFLAGRLRQGLRLGSQAQLQVCRRIAALGELTPDDRRDYADSLWATRDGSPEALLAYANCLEHAEDADPAMSAFLHERIGIDENTPEHAIRQRLPFCHRMLIQPGPGGQPTQASRYIGIGYLRLNEAARALPFLQLAAQRHDPGGVSAFHLGQALNELGRYADADQAFRQAVEHNYSRSRVLGWQALAKAKAGNYGGALELFREGESVLGPGEMTSEYLAFWGRAAFLHSSAEEAEHQFRRALALDAADWRALNGLCIALHRQGRTPEAIATLEDQLGRRPAPAVTYYLLGRLNERHGARGPAIAHYRTAVERFADEAHYRLALALALDELDDDGAIPHLEEVARSPLGSFELYRRLTLRHLRLRDRQNARVWLARLEEVAQDSPAVRRMADRDLVARAVEAYQTAEYPRTLDLLHRVRNGFRDEDRVRRLEGIALALECERRLRAGEGGPALWEDIERAAALADEPGPRLLCAFTRITRGDHAAASAVLDDLAARFPGEGGVGFLHALRAYFAGEAGWSERMAAAAGAGFAGSFEPLLPLFQAVGAARRGDAAACVEHWQAWTAQPQEVLRADLPWHLLNGFAAHTLRRGVARAAQAPRILAKVGEQFPARYWDLATVLLKHEDLAARGVAAATPDKVAACDAAYHELLDQLPPERTQWVVADYSRWLQLLVLIHLHQRDAASALDALSALERLPGALPKAIERVRRSVRDRLDQPTPEAAFSLLRRDPARARVIWEQLHREDPADLSALHHLACFHWSSAHDDANGGRFEQSLPHWRKALDYYRDLYERDEYWDQLRQKGEALRQPGNPFDAGAFAQWREQALRDRVATLIEIVLHFLAEGAQRDVRQAAAVMEIVRASRVPDSLKDQMGDLLAQRRLEPDPTRLADLELALRRAHQVVEVDPHNLEARRFLLRAVTHTADVRWREGNRDALAHVKLLKSAEREAAWLETPAHAGARFPEVKKDVAAYFEGLSDMCENQGIELVSPTNAAIKRVENATDYSSHRQALTDLEGLLRRSREHFRESDGFATRSLALDPVNFPAKKRLEDHKERYATIESLLNQVQGARR